MTLDEAAQAAADRDGYLEGSVVEGRACYTLAFRAGAQHALPVLDDALIRQLHAYDREGLLEWISEQYRRAKNDG